MLVNMFFASFLRGRKACFLYNLPYVAKSLGSFALLINVKNRRCVSTSYCCGEFFAMLIGSFLFSMLIDPSVVIS